MENRPAYAIASVDNVLRLIMLLVRDGELRVSSAAAELDVVPSTAHRLLSMLRFREFVVQDEHRIYRPGPSLTAMASSRPALNLSALIKPHLEYLAEQAMETVNLLVLAGSNVRFVDSVEAPQVLRVGSRLSAVLPAYQTSGGKVLLAELGSDEVARRHPQWIQSSRELDALLRRLAVTRKQGFGTNFEESEAGVTALAVCVRQRNGRAFAALTLSAPTARFRRNQILTLLEPLQAAAEAIQRDLAAVSATETVTMNP